MIESTSIKFSGILNIIACLTYFLRLLNSAMDVKASLKHQIFYFLTKKWFCLSFIHQAWKINWSIQRIQIRFFSVYFLYSRRKYIFNDLIFEFEWWNFHCRSEAKALPQSSSQRPSWTFRSAFPTRRWFRVLPIPRKPFPIRWQRPSTIDPDFD